MKRLRIITFAVLGLAAVCLGASALMRMFRQDDTLPQITCPEGTPVISVADDDAALMNGVTAWDGKDGDLTEHILLQDVTLQEGGTIRVSYLVSDSDHHVATASRTMRYSDYTPPRFALKSPLRYSVGSSIRVKDRLTASDVLDGDLTDRIRVDSGDLSPYYEGDYPVTFEVTNSLGDTVAVTLDVTVRSTVQGEPTIRLNEYLIYQTEEEPFEPLQYLKSVSGGDEGAVSATLPEGGLQKGINRVVYTCTGYSGVQGSTVLYVVME